MQFRFSSTQSLSCRRGAPLTDSFALCFALLPAHLFTEARWNGEGSDLSAHSC